MITEYKSAYEKIFALSASEGAGRIGDYHPLRPSFILGHDPLIAILVEDFERSGFGFSRGVRKKCFFVADHFAPPSSGDRANILKRFLDFSYKSEIEDVMVFDGICHQLMVESPKAKPFSFIAGSDSHTVTAGALCSLAAGYGSMDILSLLVNGVLFERKFPVAAIEFRGKIPRFVTGRDIGLEIIRLIGEGNANNIILEYSDDTASRIHMDDRFAISNASIECGAVSGIFRPDDILADYISRRDGKPLRAVKKRFADFESDIKYSYDKSFVLDVSKLKPMAALPHDFSDVRPVRDIRGGVRVDQVYIGSCASGRTLDFEYMCRALDDIARKSRLGKIKKARKVRLIVTPSSQKVFVECIKLGYIEKLVEFGAVITNPSCGPCGGIDKGIIGDREVCLSTSTRNFCGRMGSKTSGIYIASPVTAIASAYTGEITDPREVME